MQYDDLCQWRNICEYLDSQWYKFIDSCFVESKNFTLLLPINRGKREELWSSFMIQICQYGQHPHALYHHKSPHRKDYGWRLLPGWELKIEFLEKIILFNRTPDDLPQPWRQAIWEAFFRRREQEVETQRGIQERIERNRMAREEWEKKLKAGDCPARFHCQSMTGAMAAGECPNFENCRKMVYSL